MSDFFNRDRISAVMFDLDNTLSDRKYSFSCHAKRLAEMFLGERPAEMRDEFAKLLIKLDNNGYADKKAVYAEVCRRFGLTGREKEMSAEWDRSASMFFRREPFAEEILVYLGEKYSLGLLTNGLVSTQNIKLDAIGLRHLFREVMISEETGTAKPDSEIFLMMCRRMGCAPENTVYIGDHLQNDAEGASAAGLNAVLYDRYDTYGGVFPVTVTSLEQLKELL